VKVKIHLERAVVMLAQMNLQGKKSEQIFDHHTPYLIAILNNKFQWLGAGEQQELQMTTTTMMMIMLMLLMNHLNLR
jgi:ABC-type branched-subunit amino acid transport system ATPase component